MLVFQSRRRRRVHFSVLCQDHSPNHLLVFLALAKRGNLQLHVAPTVRTCLHNLALFFSTCTISDDDDIETTFRGFRTAVQNRTTFIGRRNHGHFDHNWQCSCILTAINIPLNGHLMKKQSIN